MTDTLFNLEEYATRKVVHDPYWDELEIVQDSSGKNDRANWTVLPFPEKPDEIVLDVSGKPNVEANGQATLFYDDSEEPPEPDDYPDPESFDRAWSDWEKSHPDFKPDMTFPEQDEEEFIEDVLEESRVQGWHFEEDKVYWHCGRNSQFKITKLFHTVSKAQGYFAREVIKQKVYLSDLVPVDQKEDYLENPRVSFPEQADSLPEKPVVNQWVERYYVTRSGNKYWYDRYCYYQKRIKHIHIPNKPDLRERVEIAIAQHKLPSEIEKLIKSSC